MDQSHIYRGETRKPLMSFVEDLAESALRAAQVEVVHVGEGTVRAAVNAFAARTAGAGPREPSLGRQAGPGGKPGRSRRMGRGRGSGSRRRLG